MAIYTEALRRSGIENFDFHDPRHIFAFHLVMAGVDIGTVQELFGRRKLDMPLRYVHLAPNHKRRAINVLDRVMSQDPPQVGKVVNLTG